MNARATRVRRRVGWIWALGCCGIGNAAADGLTLEGLLDRLQPATAEALCFVEQRRSELLEAPIEVRGRLSYEDGTLIKEMLSPSRERMTLSAERFSLEGGERRIEGPLRRAPALRALRLGISGFLQRDAQTLRDLFDVEISGDDADWRIELVPRERALARRIDTLWIAGRAGVIDEIGLDERDADARVMQIVAPAEGRCEIVAGAAGDGH